jgi:aminoglycoside 6'-N-acetyltransferase I
VVALAAALWPDYPAAEHRTHMRAILAGKPHSTLPLVVFVAEQRKRIIGFVEVGLRSHAEDCDARRPVAFVEGWFVASRHRRRGVGRALIDAAEQWGRAQGCTEIASDTWIDNELSQRAHEALGFENAGRHVSYRKDLPSLDR